MPRAATAAATTIAFADGTKVPYTVGDYRQLADAAFHAGTAPRTRNSYVDEANQLAFYVIEKRRLVEGLLGYTVAIRSLAVPPHENATEVKPSGGRLTRRVTAQRFEVTNTSGSQAVIELGRHYSELKMRARDRLGDLAAVVDAGRVTGFIPAGYGADQTNGEVRLHGPTD